MSNRLISFSSLAIVCGSLMMLGTLSGCQSTINGQTLPSWAYLRDDVQYFPAGPENRLTNQKRAIEEYRASQEAFADDIAP